MDNCQNSTFLTGVKTPYTIYLKCKNSSYLGNGDQGIRGRTYTWFPRQYHDKHHCSHMGWDDISMTLNQYHNNHCHHLTNQNSCSQSRGSSLTNEIVVVVMTRTMKIRKLFELSFSVLFVCVNNFAFHNIDKYSF